MLLPNPVVVAINFHVTKTTCFSLDLFSRVAKNILFGGFGWVSYHPPPFSSNWLWKMLASWPKPFTSRGHGEHDLLGLVASCRQCVLPGSWVPCSARVGFLSLGAGGRRCRGTDGWLRLPAAPSHGAHMLKDSASARAPDQVVTRVVEGMSGGGEVLQPCGLALPGFALQRRGPGWRGSPVGVRRCLQPQAPWRRSSYPATAGQEGSTVSQQENMLM